MCDSATITTIGIQYRLTRIAETSALTAQRSTDLAEVTADMPIRSLI
jgi:hypothetical protein